MKTFERHGQRNIRQRNRFGFSLMEVMAAIVIIAIVATASVSGLSALRVKANTKIDVTNVAELNGKCQAYNLETGKWPSASLKQLQTAGYVKSATFATPFGGSYTFDATTNEVTNPNAP